MRAFLRACALTSMLVGCGGSDDDVVDRDGGAAVDAWLPPGTDAGTRDASTGPTEGRIRIEGRRLLVDGEPFEIRGVCWNPIPRGATQPAQFGNLVDRDAPLMRDAGINVVRTYGTITDERVLDVLQEHGIYVLQMVYPYGGDAPDLAIERVQATMHHPAIIGWVLGNEWNYNGLYFGLEHAIVQVRIENLAQRIHAIDPSRPVITVYGEVPSAETIAALPSIDIWGLNVYSGDTFGDRFARWAELSDKPMFLAEYGADAYNATLPGPDLAAQGYATRVLTEQILASSTARHDDGIVLGGTIFEWADEWWKDMSPGSSLDRQDVGGIAPGGGPWPDLTFNEEWWGVVDIDGNRRPAYDELQRLFRP